MLIAILNLSVQNIFAQQSPPPTSNPPVIQPASTTTPSLQNGSFWSSGPSQPKPNNAPVTIQPNSAQFNPAQPNFTQPIGVAPSLNPPANSSLPPTTIAPAFPNSSQPSSAVPPAMPSLNPPANNSAPINSPYGSGASSYSTGTSVYGAPSSTGPALGAPMNSSPYGNPAQNFQPAPVSYPNNNQNFNAPNTSTPQYTAPPQNNSVPTGDVFQNPLLPNTGSTNQPSNATPQYGAQTQIGGQTQFGQSQFNAQGVNQPIGGTTLQSAPTIAAWGEFVTAKPIAMVGGEPIISYDIEEFFIRGMENLRSKDPNTPAPTEEEKKAYTRIILKQMIETKILYADALKNVPKENLDKMRAGVAKEFEAGYIKRLLEKNNVKTRADLEKVMIKKGTTLDRESQKFFEQSLADMWERQNVKKISVVPLADVVSYYKQHQAEYEFPAKARWEQLMISFEKVSDKVQAQNTIATMGNKVIQGASLGDIAAKESHGPTAYQKGQYDWTSKDALKSKVLDEAIFKLPLNQLSPILEDESGYHIIRILERKEAGCVPFEEAQVEIRKNLIEEEQKKIKDAYIKKVKERVAVWTIFDGEKPTDEIAKEQDPLRK